MNMMHKPAARLALAIAGFTLATGAAWAEGATSAAPAATAAASSDAPPSTPGAQPTRDHYGVIFHLDSGDEPTMRKTLNNINNLLGDPRLKGKMTIELLANSQGVAVYLKTNDLEQRLRDLQAKGVILAECSNTLHEMHLKPQDLYPFISLVPSGMGEITIREGQGWAYIHPAPIPPQF